MYVLSYGVKSVSFYILALFYLLAYDEFSKMFIKHSLKVLMFSKDHFIVLGFLTLHVLIC
jgi:hypothetical protein